MSKSTPYDRTTLPTSPQTNVKLCTPRPDSWLAKSPVIVNPRQASPAAACPSTPRLTPRESQKVARDVSYYNLKKSATFPIGSASKSPKRAFMKGEQPRTGFFTASRTGFFAARLPAPLENSQPTWEKDQDIPPMAIPAAKQPVPIMEKEAKPEASKPVKIARKKRRPSEIFNLSFSFSTPSRRRPCDRTPNISPRTSMSESSPSSSTSEKRQRVDSSGSNIWGGEDISSYPFIHTLTEAHPGRPVDFKTNRDEIFGSQSDEPKVEPESYHTYLTESHRRKSSPDPRRRSPGTEFYDCRTRLHEDQLNKEARIVELSSNAPNRKRACTLERTGRTSRKAPHPPTQATSSNSSMESRYSGRTSSTTSDPSMERFLTHVRASQEARALRETDKERMKSVFVDEREKGWFDLGDKPL